MIPLIPGLKDRYKKMLADILLLIKKYMTNQHISVVNREIWNLKKLNTKTVVINEKIWNGVFYNMDRKWFFSLLSDIIRIGNLRIKGNSDTPNTILNGLFMHLTPEKRLSSIILDSNCKYFSIERYGTLAETIYLNYRGTPEEIGSWDNLVPLHDNIKVNKIVLIDCNSLEVLKTFSEFVRKFCPKIVKIEKFGLKYEPQIHKYIDFEKWHIHKYNYLFDLAAVDYTVPLGDLQSLTDISGEIYGDILCEKVNCIDFDFMELSELIQVIIHNAFINTVSKYKTINLRYDVVPFHFVDLVTQILALFRLLFVKLKHFREKTNNHSYRLITINIRDNSDITIKNNLDGSCTLLERQKQIKKIMWEDRHCRNMFMVNAKYFNNLNVDIQFL